MPSYPGVPGSVLFCTYADLLPGVMGVVIPWLAGELI